MKKYTLEIDEDCEQTFLEYLRTATEIHADICMKCQNIVITSVE